MIRMHPFLIISNTFKLFIKVIPSYLLFLIFKTTIKAEYPFTATVGYVIVALTLLIILHGLFRWRTLGYRIKNNEVDIRNYSFFQETVETIDRKKVINSTETIWFPANLLGLSDLRIQLEGNDESTILLPSIKSCDKKEILDILRTNETPSNFTNSYKLTLKEQIGALISQGILSGIFIIILSTLISNINNAIEVKDYFLIDFWKDGLQSLPYSLYLYIIILILISILLKLSKVINFSLHLDEYNQQITITKGAFEKKTMKIHRDNINGFMIQQTLIQRFFKRASIYIETIEEVNKKVVLHPFVKTQEIPFFLKRFYSEDLSINEGPWKRQGGFVSFLLLHTCLTLTLTILTFYFYNKYFILILTFLVLLSAFSFFRYRSKKYLFEKDKLLLKYGLFIQRTHILKHKNINFIKLLQLPWHPPSKRTLRIGYFNNSVRKKIRLNSIYINSISIPFSSIGLKGKDK